MPGRDPSGGGSLSGQRATVTIDGTTYEADLSGNLAVCITMGGAIGGSGPITGLDDGRIDIDLPPADWETSGQDWAAPSVDLDLGENADGIPVQLVAGGEVIESFPEYAGASGVDSYTIDGTSASGTATFIDLFQIQLSAGGQVEPPQPVQGTFEISCG